MSLLLLYIGLALVISFFCSVFEAVLLSITPSYIAHLRQESPKTAARLEKQKQHIDAPLIAILTFNTLAHTAGAAGAGAQAATVFGSDALGVFSAVLTLLILLFSEIIPKTIGANSWRALAPSVSWCLSILSFFTWPLTRCITLLTTLFGRAEPHAYIRQEMHAMADIGHASGELAEQESSILKQMLKARDLRVSAIMTPRTVMFSVADDMTLHDFVSQYRDNPFSRIPIYQERQDEIIGYVFRNDILVQEKHAPEATLHSLKKDLIAVLEQASLLSTVKLLMHKKVQIALVVNEYGSPQGVITMEDLLESLLGLEIVDSKDPAADMQHLARSIWEKRIQDNIVTISEDDQPTQPPKKGTRSPSDDT